MNSIYCDLPDASTLNPHLPKTNRPYTIIDNGLLQDERISHATRGLLCQILSRPDDWEIFVEGLVKTSKEGRDAIYKLIKEAKQFGYLKSIRNRRKNGTLTKSLYSVTDNPLPEKPEVDKKPLTENPDVDIPEVVQKTSEFHLVPESPEVDQPLTGYPDMENPTQQSKDNNKLKIKNNMREKSRFQFEKDLWLAWPKEMRKGKKKAEEYWNKLTPENRTKAVKAIQPYLDSLPNWQSPCYPQKFISPRHKLYLDYEDEGPGDGWWSNPALEKMADKEGYLIKWLEECPPNGHWPDALGPAPGKEESAFSIEFAETYGLDRFIERGNND